MSAASNYRPKHIKLLLVAESPPADEERYFYFEDAGADDPLFAEVCTVLFESEPADKVPNLKELRRRGVFVTELKPDAPGAGDSLAPYVPPFLINVETLAADHIVLIGADVHAAAFAAMKKAGLPVVDVKIAPPQSGDRTAFRQALRQALVRADLEKLIRPLPKPKAP